MRSEGYGSWVCVSVCVSAQDLLLSDSEDSDSDLSETEQVALALELHYRKRKRWKKRLRTDPQVQYVQIPRYSMFICTYMCTLTQ